MGKVKRVATPCEVGRGKVLQQPPPDLPHHTSSLGGGGGAGQSERDKIEVGQIEDGVAVTDEPVGRCGKAVERESAKLAGVDTHPADEQHGDPPQAKLAEIDPRRRAGNLKHLGGSHSDPVNIRIANDAKEATWMTSQEDRSRAVEEVGDMMAGINPGDILEGLLASQLIAASAAAMECFRRAMIPSQTVPGREMNLNQANKASRTYVALLEALNRHRGKGQQKVRVEHVHVYPGGQAVVGHVETGGPGAHLENQRQPHARALGNQLQVGSEMLGEDQGRESVPQSCDAERPMPNARRRQPRRADG